MSKPKIKSPTHLFLFLFFALTSLLGGCSARAIPNGSTSAPKPTSSVFVLPSGDFVMSWDVFNSMYNSSGGILTIRRQGSTYSETIAYADGSCGSIELTLISDDLEIELTDRPGNTFGDKMVITSDGYLNFYDNQGIIYGVPFIRDTSGFITDCAQSQGTQGQVINVEMSLLSADSLPGDLLKITLSTNLPDEMRLMISLKGPDGYWAQDNPAVQDGQLVTTFGKVAAGIYEITITSPVVSVQPEKVKPILGENGNNMTGDLIIYDQAWESFFLEFKNPIEVK